MAVAKRKPLTAIDAAGSPEEGRQVTKTQPKTERVTAEAFRAELLAEIDAELAEIAAAEHRNNEALAGKREQAAQIRAEHAERTELARARLEPPPTFPELPDSSSEQRLAHQLARRRTEVHERRQQTLGGAVADAEAAWQQIRPDLELKAREIAAQAEEWAVGAGAWWSLLRDARAASESSPSARIVNGPSARMLPRPTAATVIDAAAGVDVCGVGPLLNDHALVSREPIEAREVATR